MRALWARWHTHTHLKRSTMGAKGSGGHCPSLLSPTSCIRKVADTLTERWLHSREAQSSRCASQSSWSHWGVHPLPPPHRSWFWAGGCAPWALLTPLDETEGKGRWLKGLPYAAWADSLAPFGYFLSKDLFCCCFALSSLKKKKNLLRNYTVRALSEQCSL